LAPPQAVPVKLPADVLAFFEVGNLLSFEGKVRDVAQEVEPTAMVPSFTQEMPSRVFRTADASTVDMTKPFEGVVLMPPYHHEAVLIFTVTDPARYLDSLQDLVKQRDEDGVHVYATAPRQGGPPGQEAPQAEGGPTQGGKAVVIGIEGNRAVMGSNAEAVKKVIALIKAGNFSAEPAFKDSDAGGMVRLKVLLDALDAEGRSPFATMKQSVAMMPQMGAPAGMNVSELLTAYVDGIEALAKQLDTATGRLSVDKTTIAGSFAVQPVADSGVAKYLSQTAAGGGLELLKYMPSGAMIVADAKFGDLMPLTEWYGKVMASVLPGESQAAVKAMTDLMHESLANLGNEMAMSVSRNGEGPLLLVSATKVKDVSAMKRIVESMPARMQGFLEAQKAMGMTTTVKANPNAISYAGLQISEWEFNYDFNVQPPPGPFGPQQAAMQKAMITAVWGAEVKAYSTFKDNTLLHTQGAGALDALKGILDGKTKSVAGSEALAAALQGMPAKPVAEGYISLQDLAGFFMSTLIEAGFRQAMMQAMVPVGQAMPAMPKPEFKPAPPIGFAAQIAEGGTLEGQIRIPVEAISSIADGIKSMNQPAEAFRMQPPAEAQPVQPPPPPPPVPPVQP
jgi:hypothetical protein